MQSLTLRPSDVVRARALLAAVPRDRAVAELVEEEEAAYDRRTLRERRGGGGGWPCGGCRRILRRRNGECPSCGFNGAGYAGARA